MSKLLKMAAVLLIVTVAFGCASTKTSTSKPEEPTGTPSGTIHWDGYQFMALLEGQWGHGTLAYNGKVYKFKTAALGAGGWGGQKVSATGNVYNLKDIADFPGKYSQVRSGATVVEGVTYAYLRNDKGVEVYIKADTQGLALSLGATGVTIEMVDEK